MQLMKRRKQTHHQLFDSSSLQKLKTAALCALCVRMNWRPPPPLAQERNLLLFGFHLLMRILLYAPRTMHMYSICQVRIVYTMEIKQSIITHTLCVNQLQPCCSIDRWLDKSWFGRFIEF